MYRTIFACIIIISVPIFITMEISIRILDCLMGYKSALLRIKKMLGINCGYNDDDNDDNNDIYDDDNDKDVGGTDE